jgi:hypothetical protein
MNATDARTTKQDLLTLGAVALVFLVCPVMNVLHIVESPWFHAAHSFLFAALILNIRGWKVTLPESRPGFVASVFFIFGAMFFVSATYGLFFDLISVAQPVPVKPAVPEGLSPLAPEVLSVNISLLLIAPITEEIICRFGALAALMRLTRSPVLSLALSSLIFAEMHFAVQPQSLMPQLFFIGLVLGLTYLVLGLPWSIALHFLFNARETIVEHLPNDAMKVGYIAFLFVSVVVFLYRIFRSRKTVFGAVASSH